MHRVTTQTLTAAVAAEPMRFTLHATDGRARRGTLATPHGDIATPAFMPVGTQATVKAMHPQSVRALGADVVLGNTYHLMLRPTAERVAALGGLHRFMNWPHAILTDSGGFQVMSLAALTTLTDQGATFRSHIDGSRHELSPERAVEIQRLLGSDISMQLDECVALPATRAAMERAMHRSLAWAERCRVAFEAGGGPGRGQGLFAIVQGGDDAGLRAESARRLVEMPFEGFAIGGLAVGEPAAVREAMVEVATAILPAERPRYLMGVGTPDDLLAAVLRGVDMFDCVMPTRAGRHGLAFTRFGKLNLKNARHMDDPRPLDAASPVPAARDWSRAYLSHLVRAGEPLAAMLLTEVNLGYYLGLMADLRAAIAAGTTADFAAATREGWARGDSAGAG